MTQEQKVDASTKEFAVIVGVGPGLGRQLALKFASNNYNIILVSRSGKSSTPIQEEINKLYKDVCVECLKADTTDETSVKTEYGKLMESKSTELGSCGVLCYNAGPHFTGPISALDTKIDNFNNQLKVGCTGALIWAQTVLPGMLENKKGTLLLTGATAALRGGGKMQELACPKFALRALSQSLAREFQPQNIHTAHIIVDGLIYGPKTAQFKAKEDSMLPEDMAEAYWNLHCQNKSAWTQELDLRPYVEKF